MHHKYRNSYMRKHPASLGYWDNDSVTAYGLTFAPIKSFEMGCTAEAYFKLIKKCMRDSFKVYTKDRELRYGP